MENYGILLVDDEAAYQAILSAVLEPRGGHVEGVGDTAAAVDAARSRSFDLVLVDIQLAAGDGYETPGEIRRAADWARAVPMLAFTTQHLSGGERHYVDAGFDGWLPKPFRAADLIMSLQRWIGADRIGPVDLPSENRLAALLGQAAAAGMIDRFHASLADGVAGIEAGGDIRAIAHRLGGLAGTLGFPALSAAWLALEQSGLPVWPTVRALAMEAIARHGDAASAV
jgi:CheY-like chemotaxis protein